MTQRIAYSPASGRWAACRIDEQLHARVKEYARTAPRNGMTEMGIGMLVLNEIIQVREVDAKIRTCLIKTAKLFGLVVEEWHVVDLPYDKTAPRIRRAEVAKIEEECRDVLSDLVETSGPGNICFAEPENHMILPALVREGRATILLKLHGYATEPLADYGLYRDEKF